MAEPSADRRGRDENVETAEDDGLTLRAVPLGDAPDLPTPGTARRAWMDRTDRHFAYRCLPLSMANESGWVLASNCDVTIHWSGGPRQENLSIDVHTADGPVRPFSHFGHGVCTWSIPYVFRTSPGFDLHVGGPPNWPKDGVYALSAVVETDWLPATFTMNWVVTRPHHPIQFTRGEPICMIAPVRRADLEQVRPSVADPESSRPLLEKYQEWHNSRADFINGLWEGAPESASGWQQDYYRGRYLDGTRAPEHRTRVRLRPFRRPDPPGRPG